MNRRVLASFSVVVISIFLLLIGGVWWWLNIPIEPAEIMRDNYRLNFNDSVSGVEREFLEEKMKDFKLESDLTFNTVTKLQYKEDDFVYKIYLPVVEFRDWKDNVGGNEVLARMKNWEILSDQEKADEIKKTGWNLIEADELRPKHKLLSIGNKYFLDNPSEGAIFKTFTVEGEQLQKVKAFLARAVGENKFNNSNILSVTQTGVTALTRKLGSRFKRQGFLDDFSTKVAPILKKSDFTHISNEVSFVQGCEVGPTALSLCAEPETMKIIENIGTDIIELTGNHNNDYGTDLNTETINLYNHKKIKTFGGGRNSNEARMPLNITEKDNNLVFLGYNHSTSSIENGQLANSEHAGANGYREDIAASQLKEAKKAKRIAIVSVQFFECYSYPAEGQEMPECDKPINGQKEFFRRLVDMGADIVIGTQAHQPQVYEIYKDKPIFYGLGNLFFDQSSWPGTSRSLVLTHYFFRNKHIQTRIIPTEYDKDFIPNFMEKAKREWFIKRLGATIF